MMLMVCLFDLILYIPSTIFQLNRDRSSWVEPVLSLDKCVLLKDHPNSEAGEARIKSIMVLTFDEIYESFYGHHSNILKYTMMSITSEHGCITW